jgi:hypothetical protein
MLIVSSRSPPAPPRRRGRYVAHHVLRVAQKENQSPKHTPLQPEYQHCSLRAQNAVYTNQGCHQLIVAIDPPLLNVPPVAMFVPRRLFTPELQSMQDMVFGHRDTVAGL